MCHKLQRPRNPITELFIIKYSRAQFNISSSNISLREHKRHSKPTGAVLRTNTSREFIANGKLYLQGEPLTLHFK